MSELINTRDNRAAIRWKLLTSASALALGISFAAAARAEDADRPLVWIELGGQFEGTQSNQKAFAPPFFSNATPDVLAPMVQAQKLPPHSFGEDGKISFEPANSNWIISASVRYGRSSATRHQHHQTAHTVVPSTVIGKYFGSSGSTLFEFGDGQGNTRESHLVADFQAGKDVGLGLFGAKGTSAVSAGVRFAQFTAGSNVVLQARPTYVSTVLNRPGKYTRREEHFHSNTAVIQSRRDTHAVGPTLSWNASLPVVGQSSGASIAFDWGLNAAVLFGRQRARIHHQTAGYYFNGRHIGASAFRSHYLHPPVDSNRSRSVAIPNAGGFAGISFRYGDAKVSFGYRGDFFFNAEDTGWDTRKSSMVGFHGPFASLSVGLGD